MLSTINTNKSWFPALLLLIAVLFSPACNITKKVLVGDQVLLHKNKIEGAKKKDFKDIKDYIRYKPNRKILGVFKFHLWLWRIAEVRKKENAPVKKFIQERAEAPVLLDTSLIELTVKNLEQYAFNKGYFNAKVTYSTKIVFNRATVTYKLEPGLAYFVNDVKYVAYDRELDSFVNSIKEKTLIKKDQQINYDMISEERDRITTELRNQGYYFFNKQFVEVKLDSSIGNRKVNMRVMVKNFSDYERHERQRVSHITMRIKYDLDSIDWPDSIVYGGVTIYHDFFPVFPSTLRNAVLFTPGDYFSQQRLENTYSRLVELGLFKFINIEYEKGPTPGTLKMVVYLVPNKKREYSVELQGITSDQNRQITQQNNVQNYGLAFGLQYKNKNVFKDASVFELRTRSSIEAQFQKEAEGGFLKNLQRSGFEQSVTANLTFPRLLFFRKLDRKPYVRSSKTTLSMSYIYETNRDFTRKVMPASYNYQINLKKISLIVTPAEVSFNRPNIEDTLLNKLLASSLSARNFVRNIFTKNLITASRVMLIYNGKQFSKRKGYFFLRTNMLEWAGNLLWLGRKYQNYDSGNSAYEILGVKYFQYVKSDFDLRYNHRINSRHSFVLRLNMGAGYPYGNTKQLPFEKRFFIGGSNSLRAWRPRLLGPGSYTSGAELQIDRSGELLILSNFEYRFNIIESFLEGAVFLDAGNIWNIRKDTSLKNAEFDFTRFPDEIAMNTGLGFRFDFTFFLVRLDWGIPIRDPKFPLGERLVIADIFRKKGWINDRTVLNLGIGYPF